MPLNTASYRKLRVIKNKSQENVTQGLKTLKALFYYSESFKMKILVFFCVDDSDTKNIANKSIADYMHSCINDQNTYCI